MTRPGDRLRRFAARWCCPETMARVIDPLIADLQREHGEAARRGRVWRSRVIRVAGWLAFFKVIAICAWSGELAPHRWTPDDRKALVRALVIASVLIVVVTALLVIPSAGNYPKMLLHPSPKRFLYLTPYPLVAGGVIGVTLGIVLGLGGRALSRRLVASAIGCALASSAVAFVDLGWVAPSASLAYRITVFGNTDPMPGIGEQSLGELRRHIEQFTLDPALAHFGLLAALSFDYHRRVALSVSPLVFTLFALVLAGCFRRRWVPGIVACLAIVVYGWLIGMVTPWRMQWPVYAAAWLPNATIATLAAPFGILNASRRRTHRSRA